MVRPFVGRQSADEEDSGDLFLGGLVGQGDDRVGALRSQAYVAKPTSARADLVDSETASTVNLR